MVNSKLMFILAAQKLVSLMEIKEILVELKAGKPSAFRYLFDQYYDGLVLFANHWLNDAEAAEDVVQECFVDFWVNRRFEKITDGLDKYLVQSVKHASLNYIRASKRREFRHELAAEYEDVSVQEEQQGEWERLYTAIQQLPEERKRIFMMVCLEGKKYKEVADLLGISINTVKTQMGRAFQYLRETLKSPETLILLCLVQRRCSSDLSGYF